MQVNRKMRGFVLATIFSSFWLFSSTVEAKEKDTEKKLEMIAIDLELQKDRPTIILVDKNLQIIAEFYGDYDGVKNKFQDTFKHVGILVEHEGQRIYLLLAK